MNWDKAKNVAIIFLIMLNAVLIAFIVANSNAYSLSAEREAAIQKVLSQNGISLYTSIPKKYPPAAQVQLAPANYVEAEIVTAFFGSKEGLSRVREYDGTTWSDDKGRTLTFTGDEVIFEAEECGVPFTEAGVREYCDGFMRQNSGWLPDCELDNPYGIETRDGFQLEYRQVYRGKIIYTNCVTFTFLPGGQMYMYYTYNKPADTEKKTRDIIAPDEALFALMLHIMNMYRDREFIINGIDIVYDREKSGEDITQSLKTVPCYRFRIEGIETPFLINAYTGVVQ